MVSEIPTIFRFSDSQIWIWKYMKIIYFKEIPMISCIFWNLLVIITGSTGPDWSRFSESVRSSRNHLKSIAIGPESLISHFGIIKSYKTPNNTLKNISDEQHTQNKLRKSRFIDTSLDLVAQTAPPLQHLTKLSFNHLGPGQSKIRQTIRRVVCFSLFFNVCIWFHGF